MSVIKHLRHRKKSEEEKLRMFCNKVTWQYILHVHFICYTDDTFAVMQAALLEALWALGIIMYMKKGK